MKFIFNLIIRLVISMLALILTAAIMPGIMVQSVGAGLWAALILGLVNTFIKPGLTILTLPFTFITFGLFLFVINGLMLLLTASIVGGFQVSGLLAATVGSIMLSFINSLMNEAIEEKSYY